MRKFINTHESHTCHSNNSHSIGTMCHNALCGVNSLAAHERRKDDIACFGTPINSSTYNKKWVTIAT